MVYDLTFEEAMDVLQNRMGLVQGEKFNQDEYLSIDRVDKYFIKNVVKDKRLNWWDRCSDQTREIYTDIKFMPEEMRTQKYRFIFVMNPDAVKGIGAFSDGFGRDSYLMYKNMGKRTRNLAE